MGSVSIVLAQSDKSGRRAALGAGLGVLPRLCSYFWVVERCGMRAPWRRAERSCSLDACREGRCLARRATHVYTGRGRGGRPQGSPDHSARASAGSQGLLLLSENSQAPAFCRPHSVCSHFCPVVLHVISSSTLLSKYSTASGPLDAGPSDVCLHGASEPPASALLCTWKPARAGGGSPQYFIR